MRLYLDLDGVLADFDGACAEQGVFINRSVNRLFERNVDKSEWTNEEKEHEARIHRLMEKPGFFRNLGLMPGARDLWNLTPKPYVLTARPKVEDVNHRVANEKRDWIEEHFGQVPEDRFICCLRSEKAKYAASWKGGYQTGMNILVDDLEWNCSEWRRAGGYAILYKNAEQAINDLKEVKSRIG